ncbi:MAG: SGNH/GDSL hydrolase family protein, partial [Actinomycetota bacterium]|nr:SGNH/GDSL hydrolase family protein [Actinomycetota bacterium]
ALTAMPLAAGCRDEDGEPAAGTTARTGEGGRTVIAALGDSITAGSPGFDPDPGARAAYGFGDDERSSFGYWAERAAASLEIRNCGVFGERTEEIAARLESCAEGADGVIVQGGINDIAQRYGVDDAAANLSEIVEQAKRMGLRVAIADVLPWNNGYPAADPQIQALNLLIAEIAADEQIRLLPFHDTLEDRDNPGRMKPEWTEDGDHPSIEGYRRLGELAFQLPDSP